MCQLPYCWPQLLLTRADVSPFALAVKFYWAVLQIESSILYLMWLEILATLCNKVRFLLSTIRPTSGFHVSCFPGLRTLNYSPLGFASLPTHVIFSKKIMLEEQPHLWLQLAALKACHTGTLLLPVVGLQKGVRVLCWGVLLGCFSDFFHISLVWMLIWKSLLN